MYSLSKNGDAVCDVIFQAAGGAGYGVFDAAKSDILRKVIGVDVDQTELAPENVLTSVVKKIQPAVGAIVDDCAAGNSIGGARFTLGLRENGTGISKNNGNINDSLYLETMMISGKIINGDITVEWTD